MKQDSFPTVMTLGHSTHTIAVYLRLLLENAASLMIDVRTIPRSRHNPQFNRELLPDSLKTVMVKYLHMPELGGLRKTVPDSINSGFRNAGFRGYADYMQTEEFERGLIKLLDVINGERSVLMCAEALPWKCHRWLLSDALTLRGVRVAHILPQGNLTPHVVTSWASINGTHITYPSKRQDTGNEYPVQ